MPHLHLLARYLRDDPRQGYTAMRMVVDIAAVGKWRHCRYMDRAAIGIGEAFHCGIAIRSTSIERTQVHFMNQTVASNPASTNPFSPRKSTHTFARLMSPSEATHN